MKSQLPECFQELSDAKREGFLKVKEVKDRGELVAGIFCSFTPREILEAAGLHHVGLCGMSNETIPYAEKDLPKNICPLILSSYGYAISNQCPFMYFSDVVVGETTCDGKKKMYEYLSRFKNVYILQLPQDVTNPDALYLYTRELKRLKDYLQETFSVKVTDEKLRQMCHLENELRKIKYKIMEMQKMDPPAYWGYDLYRLMDGTGFLFDENAVLEKLNVVYDEIKKNYENGVRSVPENAKRILISGCPSMGVLDKTVKVLEECGGVVVCYENCGGKKTQRHLIDENADDIYEAIAEHYLSIGCAVMSPDVRRFQLLEELVDEFRVDAIVEVDLRECQTYEIESVKVNEFADSKGIPYLQVTTDYSEADEGQMKTRLEAFMELVSL